MPCDSNKRSQRKYYQRIRDIISRTLTLDDVVKNGNVSSRGSYFDGDLEASGYLLGDGTFITNLPYVSGPTNLTLDDVATNGNVVTVSGAYFNGDLEASGYLIGDGSLISNLPLNDLQNVTTSGASTTHKVNFTNGTTSLTCNGNIVALGNITSSHLIGNGEFMGGVANAHELSQLESNITTLESNIMITNTSALTDVQTGDILVSTTNSNLGKLAIGSIQEQVLYANTTTSQPEWKNLTDILDVESRLTDIENSNIFISTPNLTSVTIGDILYGYDTDDLRRLAPQTTADNTFLTTGDYGTGFGRLLRVNEWGNNVMWLHPSNYTENIGNDPIFTTGTSGTLDYITIELRTDKILKGLSNRIPIAQGAPASDLLFSVRFNDSMFYSENGRSYSGTGSTKHPSGINWKLYTYGDIYGNLNGDGGFMVFPQFSITPIGGTLNPSGSNPLGKAGELLVFSDKRRKSKIRYMSKSLDTLCKLIPKIYEKGGKRESGFIAQEIYYDARELRHIVWPDRDANPNDDAPEPGYSDWGKRPACLRYLHFIAYVVKSIQELKERIEQLKNNKM